jgi:hypothetical protein
MKNITKKSVCAACFSTLPSGHGASMCAKCCARYAKPQGE